MGKTSADREYWDVSRYMDRVKEAIKKNLPNIVSSVDLNKVGKKGKVRIRMPDIEPMWLKPKREDQGGKGNRGGRPGDEHTDVLVVEMDIEELKEMVWEELGLPNFVEKRGELEEEETRLEGYTRKGPLSRLSIKKTLLEQIKSGGIVHEEIFRYRDIHTKVAPTANAVVIFARDRSGSITEDMVGTIKTAAWWVLEWLRSTHQHVRTHFITHDSVAEEVGEREFFGQTSGGGTYITSAIRLSWKILKENYPKSSWNRYILYFGDGDGSTGDIKESIRLLREEISPNIELFAYGETLGGFGSPFGNVLTSKGTEPKILEGGFLWHMRDVFGPEGTERVRFGPLYWEGITAWLKTCFGRAT